ncbi:hypothetical protein ACWDV7_19465 [Streptomyces sp. NPDC003362]
MNSERPDNDDEVVEEAGAVERETEGRATEERVAEERAAEEHAVEERAAEDLEPQEREPDEREPQQRQPDERDPQQLEPEDLGPQERQPSEREPQQLRPEEPDPPQPGPEELDPRRREPEELDPQELDPERAERSAPGPEAGPSGSRHRSPALIAAVAAAVLLVGGGGAYLAASAGGGSGAGSGSGVPGGNGTPPPLALDGYSEGGGNGIAPGEPDPNGVTYTASGDLPKGPGSAPVHWAKGDVTREDVTRLAAALGLEGKPVAEGQAWKVGSDKDGQGPSLQVNRQAPGTWTFHRYAPGTDDCEGVTVCSKPPASPSADPVSEAAARKAAAPVLRALGQDSAEVDASRTLGAQRVVNADPVVGGLPTYGWPTGLTVGAQGEVVAGSGQLKTPVKGDTYPVLDARRTLDRLNGAQEPVRTGGIGGCASPVPLEEDGPQASCEVSAPSVSPREPVVVEKAVFGLAAHSVDARPTLVPSWLFEVRAPGAADGYTVTYPAIDPRYLTSPAPPGEPSGQPSPRPTGPDAPGDTRDVKVEGYTTEGTELTVAFTGGVCSDYEATVKESADRVTVTVTETPWPDKVCIMIAKVHHRTVELDEPLGDREVVGSDGEGVPLEKPGARLPAPQ